MDGLGEMMADGGVAKQIHAGLPAKQRKAVPAASAVSGAGLRGRVQALHAAVNALRRECLALNHDAYQDLDDPIVRRELRQLDEEQKYIFTTSENVVGSFYWALRMGSGWDPRPTEDFPRGRQVDGTSSARSLRSFPFRVWSLLEMAKDGIATPLNAPPPEGTCALPPMSPPTASPKAA